MSAVSAEDINATDNGTDVSDVNQDAVVPSDDVQDDDVDDSADVNKNASFSKNAQTTYIKGKNFSVDDFTCALIRFEDGLVMDFRMSWAMHMDTMGDTLFLGTEAGLKVKSAALLESGC